MDPNEANRKALEDQERKRIANQKWNWEFNNWRWEKQQKDAFHARHTGGRNDGTGLGGIVCVLAIVLAVAGFPQAAVAIVAGAVGLYLALIVLGWILGWLFRGIAITLKEILRFPFVVIGRLITGRPITGRHQGTTSEEDEMSGEGPAPAQETSERYERQSRKRVSKQPIGWIRFLLCTVLMVIPSFFMFYIGLGLLEAVFEESMGVEIDMIAYIPEAVELFSITVFAAMLAYFFLREGLRWNRLF